MEAAGRRLTYGELDECVNRAATVLRAAGVSSGDRVALLAENRPEYLELELACAMLGAILACQNWRLAPPELCHCIGLVSPTPVVVGPAGLETGATQRQRRDIFVEHPPTKNHKLRRSDIIGEYAAFDGALDQMDCERIRPGS